ncbi:hypothetical protein ABZY44_00640 [Streptomyces sp. NPDC006544]|uniref:hypothetical protein n=1 Tax=Streptomyces sp. NPDC006544 TaxID=3154583 RepID=UPI0033A3D10C
MSTVSRSRHRSLALVRAAAVAACAGALLALPTAAALAEGVPAASSAHAAGAAVTPQRTLVKTLSLADGSSTANVYRVAEDAYQAEVLSADGSKAATVTSRDGVPGFASAGTMHLALHEDGRLSSWTGDDASVPGQRHALAGSGHHKTGSRDGAVVPASAPVSAAASGPAAALRLHTLADGPGDGVLLLAAGGAIAATGAAGLGFAMLRRGRTEA